MKKLFVSLEYKSCPFTLKTHIDFSLDDLRQSESVSQFRETLRTVSNNWLQEKQRLSEIVNDKEPTLTGKICK